MKNPKIYHFSSIADHRGMLNFIEAERDIPFKIKRVYYMQGLNEQPRGFHAHKTLRQVLICLHGQFSLLLQSDLSKPQQIILDSPKKGVLVDKLVWHELYDFSENCIVLALASDYYHESDYIRDKSVFLKSIQQN